MLHAQGDRTLSNGSLTPWSPISSSTNHKLQCSCFFFFNLRLKKRKKKQLVDWCTCLCQTELVFTPFVFLLKSRLLVFGLWVISQLASSCLRSSRPIVFDRRADGVNGGPASADADVASDSCASAANYSSCSLQRILHTHTHTSRFPHAHNEVCSASHVNTHRCCIKTL